MMRPWWKTSSAGVLVPDSNLIVDYIAHTGARGDWAQEVINWIGKRNYTLAAPALLFPEVVQGLRKLAAANTPPPSSQEAAAPSDRPPQCWCESHYPSTRPG